MATCLFRSPLAFRLQCFLEARKKVGQRGVASQKILIYLDRFLLSELQPGETITREVAERWIKSVESLTSWRNSGVVCRGARSWNRFSR